MKRCVVCGSDNADDAIECRQCGERAFATIEPPVIPASKNFRAKRLLFRFAVAVVIGLSVSALSLWVAWGNACNAELARPEQFFTQHNLRQIAKGIEDFHQKFGSYPHSLDDVRNSVTNQDYWVGSDVDGAPKMVDGWGRPFLFSTNGNSCLLTSYGRDGLPGGKGLDCDLTSRDWAPKDARPTFYQFLHDMPVQGMINSCLVCGAMACLLALITIKVPNLESKGLFVLAVKFGATILGATLVAIIISGLHIPSGH